MPRVPRVRGTSLLVMTRVSTFERAADQSVPTTLAHNQLGPALPRRCRRYAMKLPAWPDIPLTPFISESTPFPKEDGTLASWQGQ